MDVDEGKPGEKEHFPHRNSLDGATLSYDPDPGTIWCNGDDTGKPSYIRQEVSSCTTGRMRTFIQENNLG
jgi:hypothetical protein